MASTVLVLVLTLIGCLLVGLGALAATFFLARRNGQRLKSMGLSPIHGYTAEFFPPEEEKGGQN